MATGVIDDKNRHLRKKFFSAARSLGPGMVMIISDKISITNALAKHLAGIGFGIMIVSPDSELKCLDAGCPSLILIDCYGNGHDPANHLRVSGSIPVICLTATRCGDLPGLFEQACLDELTATSGQIEALVAEILHKIKRRKTETSGNPEPCFVEYDPRKRLNFSASLPAVLTNPGQQVTALRNSELDPGPASAGDNAISVLIVSECEKKAMALSRHIACFEHILPVKAGAVVPEHAPSWLEQLAPDVLLLDIGVPETVLSERLRTIREKSAATKIVMLHDGSLPDCLELIVEFGVSGCVSMDSPPQLILKAVRAVCAGEFWLPRSVLAQVFKEVLSRPGNGRVKTDCRVIGSAEQVALLTPQERRVAELVAQGLTNKEIARRCTISPETIKKHLQKIFEKLGINRRSQLAILQANERLLQRTDAVSGKIKAA
ncbi:LuxR C-terminal-related transcriptional regulator [Methylosarcina fibrata]|uniref:LuxR C-terminal-related transcriptional regulator n=1 Tax=Methylosarcina fibrata TaxID=105972 RepID=UPI0003730411|nr:LuxR C-terminal-related transcriptional regulator [Methylosarcina fibrata]